MQFVARMRLSKIWFVYRSRTTFRNLSWSRCSSVDAQPRGGRVTRQASKTTRRMRQLHFRQSCDLAQFIGTFITVIWKIKLVLLEIAFRRSSRNLGHCRLGGYIWAIFSV